MVREFITTVYRMVLSGRWDELNSYIATIALLAKQVTVELRAGAPQDEARKGE